MPASSLYDDDLIGPVLPPPRLPELRQAQPPGLGEWIYNHLFSSLNEGLPAPKHWAGEGLPPEPTVTTGKLANLGLLAAGGMGGGIPALARVIPPSLLSTPSQVVRGMVSSTLGSHAGGAVGEYLGGDVGRDIGETLGANIGVPLPGRMAAKKEVVAIPPIGPLEGTTAVNRWGEAQPVFHGTGHDYPEHDPTVGKPEKLLYGPGIYYTTAGQNIAEGYSGYGLQNKLEKDLKQVQGQHEDTWRKMVKRFDVLMKRVPPEDEERLTRAIESANPGNIGGAFGGDPARKELARLREQRLENTLLDVADDAAWRDDHQSKDLAMRLRDLYNNLVEHKRRSEDLSWRLEQLPKGNPNIRPAYLNIRNPFNIDKEMGGQELADFTTAIERHPLAQHASPLADKIRRVASDIRARTEESPESTERGLDLYDALTYALGSKKSVNNFLQQAGYDGITHIGGGRFRGAPYAPMTHRVYIAFKPEQVVPYFHPDLTEAQVAQIEKQKAKEFRDLLTRPQKPVFSKD